MLTRRRPTRESL